MTRYKKTITWQGKRRSITLTPSDHAILLRRFDPQNAILIGAHYQIGISCPLCKKFLNAGASSCSPKCPFDKFRLVGAADPTGGCRELWRGQNHDIEPAINIYCIIEWEKRDHEQAKGELKSIRDWFKSFKRVET